MSKLAQKHPRLFEPVEQQRTYQNIAERIKKAIFDGEVKPGDKLPPELELARQFHVGRQTIREALRILEISGFITIRVGSNGGSIIENTVLSKLGDSFLNAIKMEEVTLNDIAKARLEVERSIIRYVIENAKEEDIEALQQNLRKAKARLNQSLPVTLINVEFHKLLAKASRNPIFVIVMEAIMAFGIEYLSRSNITLGQSRKSYEEHLHIVEAIRSKDGERAARLIEDHIKRLGQLIQ